MLDWDKAEEYLKGCESAYAELGSAGMFAMIITINPIRERFNKGERTQELHDAIYDIAL